MASYAASVQPEKFKDFTIEINGKTVENNGSGTIWGEGNSFDCFFGTTTNYDTHSGAATSDLNTIDFLQGITTEAARIGGVPSYATFLAAVKTAGLTDLLTLAGHIWYSRQPIRHSRCCRKINVKHSWPTPMPCGPILLRGIIQRVLWGMEPLTAL